jgi:hypothetical protein
MVKRTRGRKETFKFLIRYTLYLGRWQLSTPILAVVIVLLSDMNKWGSAAIANG